MVATKKSDDLSGHCNSSSAKIKACSGRHIKPTQLESSGTADTCQTHLIVAVNG